MALITDLAKEAKWQTRSLLDDFSPKKIEFVVPMPDFTPRVANEFEGLDNGASHSILRDIKERFPANPKMAIEHPAFKTILASLSPGIAAELNPNDKQWLLRAQRRARISEELHRIIYREEIERALTDAYLTEEQLKLDRSRAFYFQRAADRMIQRTKNLEKSAERTLRLSTKFAERKIELQDEAKWKSFILLYLKEFSASKKFLKEFVHKALTEPSVSDIRLAARNTLTPLEIVIDIAQKMLPLLRKEEIEHILAQYKKEFNSVQLQFAIRKDFRQKVTKMFQSIFVNTNSEMNIKIEKKEANRIKNNVNTNFLTEKKRVRIQNNHDRVADFLGHLDQEKKLFGNLRDHIYQEAKVSDTVQDNRYFKRKTRNELVQRVPFIILGTTRYIQIDPIKFKTQLNVVKRWIDRINLMREIQSVRNAEVVDLMVENSKNYSDGVRKVRIEHDNESIRFMDAMRIRNFYRQLDVQQILAALPMIQAA